MGKGRVKSGQEELRARPGPLLPMHTKARGLSQDFTPVTEKLSEDTVENCCWALTPLPSSLYAHLRNPLGTLAFSYRKTYSGYSDVTFWHLGAVGIGKLTG